MTEKNLLKLAKILELKKVKVISDNIVASCPFASKTHKNGTDRNPSFGISIGSQSMFHCFGCGVSGSLATLPSSLSFKLGKDYVSARDFILRNDTIEFDEYDEADTITVLPALNENLLTKFSSIPQSVKADLNLKDETIAYFELKFYNKDSRLIIPIRDNFGRLVALKGRYVGSDKNQQKFIFHRGNNIKKSGAWLSIDKPLVKDKALILTESESDAWALHGTGLVNNIWCGLGACLTKTQVFKLQQVSNPVVIFFDNDKAGIEATNKLIKDLKGLMPVYKITNYYNEKDVADLVKTNKIRKALNSIKLV